jgi:GMP synthase-like glutamine amidotransferase
MDIEYIQHVPFEGPAAIADWARDRGHALSGAHVHDGDPLPDPEGADAFVVLGGPMGVGDADEYPWLPDERALVRDALDAGARVVGVCLGAQQLAAALGAEVTPHEESEIGWFPVAATDAAAQTCFGVLPEAYPVLHWHGDRFAVPDDAVLTATSEGCPTQAFVAADGRALGLQFHLEATPESVRTLVDATETLPEGRWVQSRPELLDESAPYDQLHDALYALFDEFFDGVA